jgi:hypothetical protein
MSTEPLEITIEDLEAWHPRLLVWHWIPAYVALLDESVPPPRRMTVECRDLPALAPVVLEERPLRLFWKETTAQAARRLRITHQEEAITEFAALAVAAMILPLIAQVSGLQVTERGERADYRLEGGQYVLEVSGTRQQVYLADRHREKVAQGLANPQGCDVYVVVACFEPTNRRAILSYHRQRKTHE